MNQPLSTNVNNGADEPAPKVQPIAAPHLPWTADEIDKAVLEADEAWRKAGKITRYSQQLVHALAARLPSAVHTRPVGQPDWRAATEADRTRPKLAVRWRAEDGPWIYPTSIQAESLLAHDIERCQVKDITTPVLAAKPALFVSPQQLEVLQTSRREHYTPEGGHGRYLPVRAEPAGLFTQPLYTQSDPVVRPHLTEQDALLLNQAHEILLEHAEDQRRKGNDSAAMGAECSANAVLRLSAHANWGA